MGARLSVCYMNPVVSSHVNWVSFVGRKIMKNVLSIFSGTLAWAVMSIALGQQPGFRIDTDIHFANEKEPSKQSLTLFSEGVYYDFSKDDPTAITMIDPQRNRIILLDGKRNIQTTIDMTELSKYVESAKLQADSPDLKLLLRASEQVAFNDQTSTCTVGIKQISYVATTQKPPESTIAQQYADFANWSARLNAVYPPQRPPYVRMRLNDELGNRGFLPAEIEITTTHASGKPTTARCRLLALWLLSRDDQAAIKNVGEKLAKYSKLDPAKYFAAQLAINK